MKCDSCGAPVENGKCTYCGKEFAQPQSSLKTPPAQPNGGSYYRQTPNFGQGGYVPRPPVQQAPPKKKQSFWSKTGTVVFMLIFFPLIGICLMWGYKKFNLAARIVVSAVIVFVHIGIFASGSAASSSEAENAASSSASSSVSVEEQEKPQGQIGNYICTVKSAEKCKDWNGENAVKSPIPLRIIHRMPKALIWRFRTKLIKTEWSLKAPSPKTIWMIWGLKPRLSPTQVKRFQRCMPCAMIPQMWKSKSVSLPPSARIS